MDLSARIIHTNGGVTIADNIQQIVFYEGDNVVGTFTIPGTSGHITSASSGPASDPGFIDPAYAPWESNRDLRTDISSAGTDIH